MAVGEREVERGQQAGVLGEVVGLDAEELGEFGEDRAVGVLDQRAKARRAGIAARSAVAVRGYPFAGGIAGGWFGG